MENVVLVIYFMVNGTWVSGDLVMSDGWSRREYPTQELCELRRDMANKHFVGTDLEGMSKAVCEPVNNWKLLK